MINTTTASERFYMAAYRRKAKARALRDAAFDLVKESVHPGNLGPLPPSPGVLLTKASLLGILNPGEAMEVHFHGL